MKKIFTGTVKNGKLILDDQRTFNLTVWSHNEKEIELTIERKKKNRTMQQNRYYWGIVIKILSDFTGYSDQEMHDALRMLFLLERRTITTIKSTTELTTVEFEQYLETVRGWALTELSCYIPLPNETEQ